MRFYELMKFFELMEYYKFMNIYKIIKSCELMNSCKPIKSSSYHLSIEFISLATYNFLKLPRPIAEIIISVSSRPLKKRSRVGL